MTDSLRVCHVVNAVGPTSVPADLAVAQAREGGVEPGVLAWFRDGAFDGQEHVTVRCADAPQGLLGVDRGSWARASEMIREYDIVQTHHNHSGTYAKLIARRLGVPIISVEQNNQRGFTRKGRVANSLTNRLADSVVCSSEGVRESFTRWQRAITSDRNVRVIHNGANIERVRQSLDRDWNLRAELGVDATVVLVGTAGRLVEQKAQDVLIRAVSLVAERVDQEVHLVIAGEGELRSYLEEVAAEEGIADAVHFVGLLKRERLYCLFDQVDVYAMPSRWEGFSAAAIEAMAAGATCVFSDIPELKNAYEGAARFHPVDDEAVLAAEIGELLTNAELRAELSSAAWTRAERYSTANIVREYEELYRELLA